MIKPEITICNTPEDYNNAKILTQDYMAWLGEDLFYQGIDKERDTFHIMYNKPTGSFIFIKVDNEIAGGVGVRALEDGICEMKRLFVYDKFRGHKLGKLLSEELIKISKELGYNKMRLDTIPRLNSAMKLYRELGFYEIPKYYNNPDKSVVYFEKELI